MKFTCKTCSCVFNKKMSLRAKEYKIKPRFCSKDCALAWKVVENQKIIKKRKVGQRQSSKEEIAFGNIISHHFPKLERQYQLKNYDHYYDFYSPELNLLIEYNGGYWHNMKKIRIKDKYHINEATKHGVYIAMVTDADWKRFIEDGMPKKSDLVNELNKHIKNI